MSEADIERWLHEGITAVKDGRAQQARQSFMQVLQANEENETAWLWLSRVVDSADEKRICLENVLALNPHHAAARRALTQFETGAPVSAAGPPPPTAVTAPQIIYQQEEKFDDVWSRNVEICAYCAGELAPEEQRCPHCRRNLWARLYRYPQPSTNLTAFWVTLIGVGMLYAAQAAYTVLTSSYSLPTVSGALVLLLMMGVAAGIYLRLHTAFLAALVLLVLFLFANIAQLFVLPDLANIGLDQLDAAISGFVEPLATGVWMVIKVAQLAVILLALVIGFRAAPDFERAHYRRVATVTRGLSQASDYHIAAKRLAGAGLWASAVMNWQRAAALEPTRLTYKHHLGQAYAQLGFYQRSLDVLQTAYRQSTHPDVQAELKDLIQSVMILQTPSQPGAGAKA